MASLAAGRRFTSLPDSIGSPHDPPATDSTSDWSAMSLLKAIFDSIGSGLLTGRVPGAYYDFDSATSSADPGAGEFRLNNAALASVTAMYISETDVEGASVATRLATWDDGTSTVRGRLFIIAPTSPTDFAAYDITGSLTDSGGWDTFSLTHVSSSGSFANGDRLALMFIPKGDKGDTGATGSTGAQGIQGIQGPPGEVEGPASAVSGNLASFDGTSGELIADSGVPANTVLVDGDIGSTVQGYDVDTLKSDTTKTLTAGYSATPFDAGTKTTGTFTPDEASGGLQRYINGGAHTLAPPTNQCTLVLQVTNNSSAGAITTSGFTKKTGDTITTTDGHDFFFFIVKINGFSHLHVQALQ